MTDASQPQASDKTDDRFRRMTLTEHFSYIQKLRANPPAPTPAVITQNSLNPKSDSVVRIHWDEFSGQHPAIKDVLPGQTVAPFIARIQSGLQGRTPKVQTLGPDIWFQWKLSAFGMVSSAAPVNGLYYAKGHVTDGQDTLATAYGFVMSEPNPSPYSPDYGIGYFVAYDRGILPSGPMAETDQAYCATFAVRTWFTNTVQLTANNGDGQSIFPGTFASFKLIANVTDSKGSTRAVEDMLITFTIISGDLTFSETGNTARYSRIGLNGKEAQVTVTNGLVAAPSLKAGPTRGPCTIRVTGPLSGGAALLFTVNVI